VRKGRKSRETGRSAGRGETGLIATFQENPTQLERILEGFSWSLDDPGVELMYRTPVDLYLDEWVYNLLDTVHRTGATRVAIDSLGDLRAYAEMNFASANTSIRYCNAARVPTSASL
jgi:hypothetical protein